MTDARNANGDRGLERLLRESLPPAGAGDVAACLDADTLAAWMDDALTSGERAAAEAHAAGCARCQSMLAVMIRTAPVDAAAEGSAIRRWTMMFAPALAAAAAVTLWFAVERPRQSGTPAPAGVEQAASAVGEPPAVPAPATAVPASPADAPMTQAAKKEAELMLADALRKREADERAPALESAGVRRAPEEKSLDKDGRDAKASTVADARTGNVAAARPAPAAALPSAPTAAPSGGLAETVAIQPPAAPARADDRVRQASPMQSATQSSQQQTPQSQSMQQAPNQATQQQPTQQQGAQQRPDQQQAAGFIAREAPAPQPRTETASARAAGAGRGGAEEAVQVNALRSAVEKTAVAFRSPDGSGWWRITGGRVAEASGDRGATWSSRYAADDTTVLTAGAAASPAIVWIVGRAGVVLVTTDGRTWRRVPFPENADLIAVSAADARHATVIAADGRAFATADAGATWSRK